MTTALTGSINAAFRRHQALTGLRVKAIDARYVALGDGTIPETRVDGIALLQILNAAGEDTLDVDGLVAELP